MSACGPGSQARRGVALAHGAIVAICALLVMLVTGTVPPIAMCVAAEAGDAARGRKIAETHCSRCHRLSNADRYGGIDSTPSFPLLVQRRPDYRERFETFFERRPHPAWVRIEGVSRMPNDLPPTAAPIELEASGVADIVAYVETLKSESLR